MTEWKMEGNQLVFGERKLPVLGSYDVVVAGGGMAGCGAALGAAKTGARVLLIETTSALGGLATMGLVNIPLDFVSGVGAELFARLKAIDGLRGRNSDPEKHKLVFDRMMHDAGVETLLVTPVIDTIVDRDTVKGVVVYTKTGLQAVMGARFVDSTGDSDLVFLAGGETMTGRTEDGLSMACSLEFTMGGVDFNA